MKVAPKDATDGAKTRVSGFISSFKWIMLVSGALTCTMFYAAIAPYEALQSTFGEGIDGPVADLVVRNWGILVGLIGAMLIYGAFHPAVRRPILVVAGTSKLSFVGLVFAQGDRFLGSQASMLASVDVAMLLLFGIYLMIAPRPAKAPVEVARPARRPYKVRTYP